MLLIATALSLLAIVAGMNLLARTKIENLGKLFKFISWFVILIGFLCLLFIGIRSVMHFGGKGGHHGMMKYGRCMNVNQMNCCKGREGMMHGRGGHGQMNMGADCHGMKGNTCPMGEKSRECKMDSDSSGHK